MTAGGSFCVFGERALIGESVRTATARSVTDVDTIALDKVSGKWVGHSLRMLLFFSPCVRQPQSILEDVSILEDIFALFSSASSSSYTFLQFRSGGF